MNIYRKLKNLFLKKYYFKILRLYSYAVAKRYFSGKTCEFIDLDYSLIEKYQKEYAFPKDIDYSPAGLDWTGRQRIKQIENICPMFTNYKNVLELGCCDGMVLYYMKKMGKNVTGIDLYDNFDERALAEGIKLLQMNVNEMTFKDNTFDFIFSFSSFEHFENPEKALSESLRVLKTGGYAYLDFGPLYYSPYGAHAHGNISIPYCNILFNKSLLDKYVETNGLKQFSTYYLNKWSIEDYRNLWKKYQSNLKIIKYFEKPDLRFINLIRKHPSSFRKISNNIDNFTISSIEICFQKIS
jgi:ubiquinone/menaquinone biosynthesis C-methylase UbiE